MKYVIIFLVLIQSTVAFTFPENTRKGYSSCRSCHVSPSGGGVLTAYGKMTSEEFLSKWSYEGMGSSHYGLLKKPEKWVLVGGDIRTLHTGSQDRFMKMVMQADVELAVNASEQITFVASGGYYNLPFPLHVYVDNKPESRRHYLLLKPQKWLTLRAGKFMPAYGLMIGDHSQNIRKNPGFGQGSESYNGEIGFFARSWELLASHTPENAEQPLTTTARYAHYIGKRSQVGVSLKLTRGQTIKGIFGTIGFTKRVYGMFEVDQQSWEIGTRDHLLWTRLASETTKGFHIYTGYTNTYTHAGQDPRIQYGCKWFPIPHLEFILEEQRHEKVVDYLISTHYYF